jgi:o-succinylbenzoate synthase
MLKADYKKHTLIFKFDAGTSRGVLKERDVWYIKIYDETDPSTIGIGECAPLQGLSPDHLPDFEDNLQKVLDNIHSIPTDVDNNELLSAIQKVVPQQFPSICFGLETALLDLKNGGKRKILDNDFFSGKKTIPINGLVWMGDKVWMVKQIREKAKSGYHCIKIKIGAIDFREECEVLDFIRVQYSNKKLEIRVDANGAFPLETVMEKLKVLKDFDIHSIEQPIMPGQIEEMAQLCASSPVPIALDEELIGYYSTDAKAGLLSKIKPKYIVLKPTLLGGFFHTAEWIELAEKMNIGWWITSALESNIGLNAIAQFTAKYKSPLRQGLGTGALYHNNIQSPLVVQKGTIKYDLSLNWNLDLLMD